MRLLGYQRRSCTGTSENIRVRKADSFRKSPLQRRMVTDPKIRHCIGRGEDKGGLKGGLCGGGGNWGGAVAPGLEAFADEAEDGAAILVDEF